MLKSVWQPKGFGDSGQLLARVLASDWRDLLPRLLHAGIAVTPGRSTQLNTAVVWLPKWVEGISEAEMHADELLDKLNCPSKVAVNGEDGSYTWTKESALFIKLSGRKPSFGLRVPVAHAPD
eukprot:1113324-Amphidinium_carterae.1